METIFKARSSNKEGIFVNGIFISPKWKNFCSDTLFAACKVNSFVEVRIFKNGAYEETKKDKEEILAEEKSSAKADLEDFIKTATVADLKVFLIEKGIEKRVISDLNKAALIEMVRNS